MSASNQPSGEPRSRPPAPGVGASRAVAIVLAWVLLVLVCAILPGFLGSGWTLVNPAWVESRARTVLAPLQEPAHHTAVIATVTAELLRRTGNSVPRRLQLPLQQALGSALPAQWLVNQTASALSEVARYISGRRPTLQIPIGLAPRKVVFAAEIGRLLPDLPSAEVLATVPDHIDLVLLAPPAWIGVLASARNAFQLVSTLIGPLAPLVLSAVVVLMIGPRRGLLLSGAAAVAGAVAAAAMVTFAAPLLAEKIVSAPLPAELKFLQSAAAELPAQVAAESRRWAMRLALVGGSLLLVSVAWTVLSLRERRASASSPPAR